MAYKWIALSNTTLAVLLATLDASITLIAMPDIFRGIHLDPLVPSNSFYLLWMILGYLVVSSVLIVSLGRLGDMYGRVRIYSLGFVIYTVASLLLAVTWLDGRAGADYLIFFRIVQGVGGACLLANAAAIITDAFPANQRGMALGINNIVGVSGLFVGLVLGGLLAPIDWRLVFLISVPVGLFGTVWAYMKLEERSEPRPAPIDWLGNITFALGLILIMVSVTYGIRPYGGHPTGWGSPRVLALLAGGVIFLAAFVAVEWRAANPMFRLPLFRIRAFTFGTLSTFLAAVARGGLMFILIIWLQGIWLPAAWLRLRRHSAVGGDLHAAALPGIAGRRARLRLPLGSLRGAAVRDRRNARRGRELRPADAAAGRLPLSPVRPGPAAQRDLHGTVRLTKPSRGDEQPAAAGSRRRWRDEPDLPELGAGALDRDLLHPDDRRTGLGAAADDQRRPARRTGSAPPGPIMPPKRRRSRSSSPPSSATTRSSTWSGRTPLPRWHPPTAPS